MGQHYDNPMRLTYCLPSRDFTGAAGVVAIARPAGCRFARIRDIQLSATVAWVGVTTKGEVQIGDGTDADKFATLAPETLAAGSAYGFKDGDGVAADYPRIDMDVDGNAGAAMTQLILTYTQATGSGAAGTAIPTVVIDWW